MAETTLDSLQIEIEASSDKATKRIDELTAALKRLQSATTGKFGNVGRQIDNIGATTRRTGGGEKSERQPAPTPATSTSEYAEETSAIDDNKKKTDENTKSKDKNSDATGRNGDKHKKSAKNVNELTEAFKKATTPIGKVKKLLVGNFTPFSGLKKSVNEVGLLGLGLKKLTPSIRSVAKEFGTIKSAIGRIAFYRTIRSAIKMVTDGFSEGIKNLYQYSTLVGTEFAPAMNSLATSSLYLKNSIGAMAAPLIQAVAPAIDFLIDKFVTLLNVIGKVFASLTGKGTFTQAKKQAAQFGDALSGAAGSAKELRSYLLGIDELNVIKPDNGSGGGGGGAGLDYGSMFEEVQIDSGISNWAKQIRNAIESGDWAGAGKIFAEKLNDVVKNFKWNEWGKKIGTGIQNGISFALNFVRTFNWQGLGSDIATFLNNAIDNINGKDVGALLASKWKIAIDFAYGFLTDFDFKGSGQWLADIVNGWIEEIDWEKTGETVGEAIHGAITFGFEFLKTIDWGEAVSALFDAIKGIFEELTVQDWAVISGILSIKFLPQILKKAFSGINFSDAISDVGGASGSAGELGNAIGDGTGSGLNGTLVSLAKNLGLGIGIIAEVGVAVGLIVGEIWLLGKGLEQVGLAWQPVIDNGQTVSMAIAIGTGLLVGIGVAAAGLGKITTASGGTLALDIGIGTAVLLELGGALAVFLVEIWGVGKGLDEVGKAWQPVLDNGETIKKGILFGTGLLTGIAIVTAALGAVTLATGGTLAGAIAIGTGVLVEVSEALKIFISEISSVAQKLSKKLAPTLAELNEVLPDLSDNTNNFVDYMEEFAGHIGSYAKSSVSAAFSGFVDSVVKFFTKDPIKKLADDVENTYNQVKNLNGKLSDAVPELEKAAGFLSEYESFVTEIKDVTNAHDNTALSGKMLVNMKAVGSSLVIGLATGMRTSNGQLVSALNDVETKHNDFEQKIHDIWDKISSTILDTMVSLGRNLSSKITAIRTTTLNGLKSIPSELSRSFSDITKSSSKDFDNLVAVIKAKTDLVNAAVAGSFIAMKATAITQSNSAVSSISYAWESLSKKSYTWGADIAKGLANGMKAYTATVQGAAILLATNIFRYIHFSKPDAGPLSNFDTYMPDMMKQLAYGIKSNMHLARDAISETAQTISDGISTISLEDLTLPVHRNVAVEYFLDSEMGQVPQQEQQISMSIKENNEVLIATLLSVASRIEQAIADKDSDVYLDGKEITRTVDKYHRRSGANIVQPARG